MTATKVDKQGVKILILMGIVMFFAGFSMFKLVPMQTAICTYFNIDAGAYSILASAQNIFVIALTIPFGFVTRKITPKWSSLIGIGLMLLGSALEILTTNYVLFVVGRTIEGGGVGFLTVVIYSLVANIVGPKKAGLWVSIFVSINMVSQVVNTRVSTALMENNGVPFKTIFLVMLGLELLTTIMWLIFMPGDYNIVAGNTAIKVSPEETKRVYREPGNWLVPIALGFYQMISTVFTVYAINYLVMKGLEKTEAANLYSYTMLLSIVSMIVTGWISGKWKTKRKIAIFAYFGSAATMVALVLLPKEFIIIYILMYGLLPRAITGMAQAASSDLAESPAQVPIINSLRNTVAQAIALVGGIGIGYSLQFMGYETTIFILAALQAVGGILWIFVKRVP